MSCSARVLGARAFSFRVPSSVSTPVQWPSPPQAAAFLHGQETFESERGTTTQSQPGVQSYEFQLSPNTC